MATEKLSIGVIGGSGQEGGGLALRWVAAGHDIIIGSRTADKAQASAQKLNAILGARGQMRGGTNAEAAMQSIVVLAVPYAAQLATAAALKEQLAGKILIDVTVPLLPPKVSRAQLPAEGSAVLILQRELGEGVKVVSAFQNVSAAHLKDLEHAVDCDVLVCGDDPAARETVIGLARDAGMRGWHAGVLANSAAAEALTSVLIAINRHYKVPGAGIRITGLPRD